jgi:hypothetical protein
MSQLSMYDEKLSSEKARFSEKTFDGRGQT